MVGHEPTEEVLAYIHDYYYKRGVSITFYVDDLVDPDPATPEIEVDPSVTDEEFWSYEARYNEHDEGYSSKWKWILFGTTVEGEADTVGYTYVTLSIRYHVKSGRILSVDCLAGNYIFVADGTADSWASSVGIEAYGAEAAVLMHEIGHCIGIMKVGWIGNYYRGFVLYEIYDSDSSSVMAMLSTANAGLDGAWYYSDEYWATRNMKNYAV